MTGDAVNRDAWRAQVTEAPIDPDLPIIDAHHHIWPEAPVPGTEAWGPEDLYAYKAGSGHNIAATIFVEAHARYATDGPPQLAPVGETRYADSVAREADARGGALAGTVAAIVASADMSLGAAVGEVLDAHLAASRRVRGIRSAVAWDKEMPYEMGTRSGMMAEPAFRAAFAQLAPRKLSFDIWVMQPQMADLCDLADAFPDTTIILDHIGTPLCVGRFAADRDAAFASWRSLLAKVAERPNVMVKIGGLNMPLTGLCVDYMADAPWSSEKMAAVQQRHVLTTIALFGPDRCMFESNFPVDRTLSGATTLWNSFKRIVADFSHQERTAMFFDNAARIYRLALPAQAATA